MRAHILITYLCTCRFTIRFVLGSSVSLKGCSITKVKSGGCRLLPERDFIFGRKQGRRQQQQQQHPSIFSNGLTDMHMQITFANYFNDDRNRSRQKSLLFRIASERFPLRVRKRVRGARISYLYLLRTVANDPTSTTTCRGMSTRPSHCPLRSEINFLDDTYYFHRLLASESSKSNFSRTSTYESNRHDSFLK